jgi:cytosine/adenosine deaminase-related metal-dependent hydrolase
VAGHCKQLGDAAAHRARAHDDDIHRGIRQGTHHPIVSLSVSSLAREDCPVPLTVHTADVVLPVTAAAVPGGAVAVDGDRIAAVGPRAEVLAAYPGSRERAWRGVLTPGLVNAHTHLQYTDFADLARSGLPFPQWIATLTQRRVTFTVERWRESTRRGVHALLRTGTTAAADVVADACALGPVARAGLAGVSYMEAVGADDRRWAERHRLRLIQALETAPSGRAVGVSPHTLYTLGTAVFRDCLDIARERRLRVHTHLAETAAEAEYVLSGSGPLADALRGYELEMELLTSGGARSSPTAHLALLGGLGPDVHVAHAVHCDRADRELLRSTGTAVTLCPRSNRVLDAGAPPVAAYLDEGVALAVGTDSLASAPSLDLWADVAALHALARDQGYDGGDLPRRVDGPTSLSSTCRSTPTPTRRSSPTRPGGAP